MPKKKEIHFFDSNYEKGIGWYEKIFRGRREKAIGEATPAYLYRERVTQLIKKYIPDVKLIVVVRDPVDRAYSHYCYRAPERGSNNISFERKLSMTPRLVEEGCYASHLERYLELFPRKNVLILLYDDLESHPDRFLVVVYTFLEVDVNYRSPLLENKINAASSRAGKSKEFYLLSKALIKFRLYDLAKRVDRINQKGVLPVKGATRQMLLEKYYLKDISRLEKIIGRDLSAWKRC